MTRRTTGTLLLFSAALLYSTRYLAAAVFGSSLTNWSAELETFLHSKAKG